MEGEENREVELELVEVIVEGDENRVLICKVSANHFE